MSETSRTPASSASTLSFEDMSDGQILEMIGRAGSDPFIANTLLHLQKQAYEKLEEGIQLMLAKLNEIEPVQNKMPNGVMSPVALASAARQRETAGKQRREFAELLMIGALINKDNPDWNIFDEAETTPSADNGLLALLQMQPPAPANMPG